MTSTIVGGWRIAVGTAVLLIASSTAALGATTPQLAAGCSAPVEVTSPEVHGLAAELGISTSTAAIRIGWQNGAEWLDAQARDTIAGFGGLWIEPATGRIKIGYASPTAASNLRSLADRCALGSAVDLVQVRHSETTLAAAGRWLGERIAQINDERTAGFGAGIDYSTNSVVLDVPTFRDLSSAEQRLIAAASNTWGEAVRIQPITAASAPAACSSNNFCSPPLRGGIQMYSSSAGCTLGFTARSRTDGVWYALTAGHCGGGTWVTRFADGSQHTIGPWHNGTFSSSGDAEIIRISNPSGWNPRPWVLVEASADTTRNESYTISAVGGSSIGMRICKTGYSGSTDCGTVTRLDVTVDYGSVVVHHLGEANFCVIPGDSGGPVYASHRAYGLTSGHVPGASPCRSFYQGAAGAQNLMNVNIATG